MKQVELLAPCGNYECFLAAVNAGADAVYLAGEKFGARAYSDNFTTDQLTNLIHEAHLHHVKVYLTLNTLIKQDEIDEIIPWLVPIYEAGLDGIIVQDLGVVHLIREYFPDLALHISTQMSITSHYGIDVMKNFGAERVVPARELSLSEIKQLRKNSSMELETFIHGAMCYCYSGQCLMSSFLGGRSGNRGRCAQPCRLPYQIDQKEKYYLSLKDMNTLAHLPMILDSGIESFKIEGRMKKPEYVAGVTSLYRKYIDLYAQNPEQFKIEEKDATLLQKLYIRSETGDGYYRKSRGKDMITLDKPGYNGTDEEILKSLHNQYVHELQPVRLSISIICKLGIPLQLHCKTNGVDLQITGPIIEPAQKRAATKDDLSAKLCAMGNTPFEISDFIAEMDENCFVPVKWLSTMKQELLAQLYQMTGERPHTNELDTISAKSKQAVRSQTKNSYDQPIISVSVLSFEQLKQAAYCQYIHRIYIDSVLLMNLMNENSDAAYVDVKSKLQKRSKEVQIFCTLPHIIREKDQVFLQKLHKAFLNLHCTGYVCRTIDGLGFTQTLSDPLQRLADASLYHWNTQSFAQTKDSFDGYTIPLEYNSREIRTLCQSVDKKIVSTLEMVVYGRAPLMVTANCVNLTSGHCTKQMGSNQQNDWVDLTDRKNIHFPVYTNCIHCYNVLYNSIPTSLHDSLWMLKEDGIKHYRLDFTTETSKEMNAVIQTFYNLLHFNSKNMTKTEASGILNILKETTGGHIRRGVE